MLGDPVAVNGRENSKPLHFVRREISCLIRKPEYLPAFVGRSVTRGRRSVKAEKTKRLSACFMCLWAHFFYPEKRRK